MSVMCITSVRPAAVGVAETFLSRAVVVVVVGVGVGVVVVVVS